MKNEFGITLDRNGYAPSILQRGRRGLYGGEDAPRYCYLCRQPEARGFLQQLERHEPYGAANRQKSKALGLWVNLHRGCHEEAHHDAETGRQLRADAQRAAMLKYNWTREEWIRRFGKSELSEEECTHLIPKDANRSNFRIVGQSAGGFRVILDGPELPY